MARRGLILVLLAATLAACGGTSGPSAWQQGHDLCATDIRRGDQLPLSYELTAIEVYSSGMGFDRGQAGDAAAGCTRAYQEAGLGAE